MPTHHRLTLVMVALFVVATVVAACGGKEPTPIPAQVLHPPANLLPLPSDTPGPTDTPALAAETTAPGSEATTTSPGRHVRLPAGTDTPVVQIARIEPRDSEPGLLAEMAPDFSLQAGGRAVFHHIGGPSETNWYQTALTEQQVQDFVDLLVNRAGVQRRAKAQEIKPFDLSVGPDGTPNGPAALGVIYLHTADSESRLVLTQEDLANPTDPELKQLVATLIALENWQAGVNPDVNATYTPELAAAVRNELGWWSDLRQPWTPERVIPFGTLAGGDEPRVAVANWPLEVDPGELFPNAAGGRPDFAVFDGPDAAALLATATKAGLDPNFPLWRHANDAQRYLAGLRVDVPGGNHIWVPYRSGAAPTGQATGAATAAGPTAILGSAAGRPTRAATPTATPRP